MKMPPLLCLGTPLGHWLGLTTPLLPAQNTADQNTFQTWLLSQLGPQPSSELEACLTALARETKPTASTQKDSFPNLSSNFGVLTSPLACWFVLPCLNHLPQARVLAFYERPAQMLARNLAATAPGVASVDQLLEIWEAATAKLLAALRRNRARFFLLDANACLAAPEAFKTWLQPLFPFNSEPPSEIIAPSGPDPLLLALSEILCAARPKTLALAQECEASVHPLLPEAPPASEPLGSDLPREALGIAIGLRNELADTREKLAAARLRANELDQELADTRQNAAQKLEEASGIHEMLLLEIHNAHKESEDFCEQLSLAQDTSKATSAALESLRTELSTQLTQTQSELASTQAQAAASTAELDSTRQRSHTLAQELAHSRETAAQKLEEASGIHEMLLLEIHNAHKESEDFFERWKRAETLHSQLSLKADRLVRGPIQDHSDHRHLAFSLHDAELFGRTWPRLDFRLVAHRGNAGIALFLPPHAPTPPLYTWEPAGTENGAPYVLFVPSDFKAKRSLVAATSHDLLLLKEAVALLAADLRFQGPPAHSRTNWPLIATRLLEELNDLPERLHYDAVYAEVQQLGFEKNLHFDVRNACFRNILLHSLKFTWSPSSKEPSTLILTRSTDAPPPLPHWPLPPDGSPASEWRLDLGKTQSLRARRKLWNALSSNEKAFLRLLISELPNFVFHLLQQHPKAGLDQAALTRQARALLAEAHSLSRRPSPIAKLRLALSK